MTRVMEVTRVFVKGNEQRFRKGQYRQTDQIRLVKRSKHNVSQEIQEAVKKNNETQ